MQNSAKYQANWLSFLPWDWWCTHCYYSRLS